MTTLVKRSSLVLGAIGLVAATAVTTAMVIESSTGASRTPAAALATATPAAPAAKYAAASRSRFAAPLKAAPAKSVARSTSGSRYREVTLPAGTTIRLRLGSDYSSETSSVEQRVNATVVSGVSGDGYTALPAGSRVSGVVSSVERPGKVKGRGSIGLSFSDVIVGGERYPIAASYTRVAPATKSTDAKKIGIPAAGGAIVGAILGGKKGALTGAAIGGGAGTAVVLSTRGKDAYIGSGSVIGVTLRRALTVRVPLR